MVRRNWMQTYSAVYQKIHHTGGWAKDHHLNVPSLPVHQPNNSISHRIRSCDVSSIFFSRRFSSITEFCRRWSFRCRVGLELWNVHGNREISNRHKHNYNWCREYIDVDFSFIIIVYIYRSWILFYRQFCSFVCALFLFQFLFVPSPYSNFRFLFCCFCCAFRLYV